MIRFHNSGEVEIEALTTFGVSVKDSDNPIGFFGTGFKYALATILRGGGTVDLWRGEQHFSFETHTENIRGENFDIIHMLRHKPEQTDGRSGTLLSLGFTTQLGKNWKPWMAYRELFCNAKDEGGGVEKLGFTSWKPGETNIFVEWDEFDEVFAEHSKYFIPDNRKPIFKTSEVEVFSGNSQSIFYRGVRVRELVKPTYFTYNLLRDQELTEDRTLAHNPISPIRNCWGLHCKDEKLLTQALTATNNYYEGDVDFNCSWIPVSDFFLEAVNKLNAARTTGLNETAVRRLYSDRIPDDPEEVELDFVDKGRLAKAIAFCGKLGYPVDSYPIVPTAHLGFGTLAQADRKTMKIYLSQQVFNQGTKLVAQALLEEYLHLARDLDDESRAMQTYLFEKVISLGERVLGEAL